MKHNIFCSIGLIILFSGLLTGCDSMLSEIPSKQQEIIPTKIAHLEGLIPERTTQGGDYYSAMFMSDEVGYLDGLVRNQANAFNNYNFVYGNLVLTWQMDDYSAICEDGNGACWSSAYNAIYYCNLILLYIDEIDGTAEEKNRLKGDAYFDRALQHFELLKAYTVPYSKLVGNKSDLGICLRDNINLVNLPERSTIEESYQFILDDLQRALECLASQPMTMSSVGTIAQWRASEASVNALYARVYLRYGDFAKALEHAQKALEKGKLGTLS
jgi:hypothetical protein